MRNGTSLAGSLDRCTHKCLGHIKGFDENVLTGGEFGGVRDEETCQIVEARIVHEGGRGGGGR